MQNSIYHKHQLHPATVGPCQGAAAADTSLSRDKKHHKRCRDARPVRPSTRRRIYLSHNTLCRQRPSPTNATSEDFDISEISLSRHKKSPTRGSAAALAARSQATRPTRDHRGPLGPRPYQKISRRLNTSANPTVHCGEPTVLCGEPTPTPMQGGY
jgi:hypothetical protein